ncbi:MAG TPA: quinone-dependent dihydroorotate dehydrogenase [Steroidobacteraceae bacterium]|nr:quinone-dependent dihydroorotate dehydrogenase [Steroidobacteraceae bacterium]
MYRVLRPLLFALDAERAHDLTLALLRTAPAFALAQLTARAADEHPIECLGLAFRNRIGLAAGFDKNATCIDALGALGFGFLEIGTVTARPQAGNPRPRVFRIPQAQALINRMGFPNDGAALVSARLAARRYRGICGVNIGKNASTALEAAPAEYAACLESVYPHADYVAVNVSSPNTSGLRALQEETLLIPLLESLLEARQRLQQRSGRRVPLLVKLSPDLSPEELASSAAVIVSLKLDGIIATNSTLQRPHMAGLPQAREAGGLSGRPLLEVALASVRAWRAALGPQFAIIGAGGIDCAAAARSMFEAGANLIQIYTGLVYRGPRLIADLARVS